MGGDLFKRSLSKIFNFRMGSISRGFFEEDLRYCNFRAPFHIFHTRHKSVRDTPVKNETYSLYFILRQLTHYLTYQARQQDPQRR